MKKPKLKLDVSKVKALLVQHAEKIVFGLFVLVMLYLTYSGLTLEKFDRTPQQLRDEVNRATQHVAAQKFDAKREELVFVDPTKTVAQNDVKIEAAEFPLAPMNPLVFPAADKRGEPAYLPVEELEVTASFGTFQVKAGMLDPPVAEGQPPAAANNNFAARRWVCLTGLIPYERQRRAYHEQFAKRGGGEPEWFAAIVERAEVSGAPDAPLNWQQLNPKTATAQKQLWANNSPELVPNDFQVPLTPGSAYPMLYPLGPLVGRNWMLDEVAHSKIRAIMLAEAPPAAAPAGAAAPAPAPGAAPLVASEPVAEAAPADDMDVFGADVARPVDNAAPKPAAAPAVKPVRDMRAFRYFDFDVEPGKRYRYRVTLYFKNPNFGQAARDLADPKLALGPRRNSPPSEPSPEITVPRDAGVLVARFVKARGANEIGVDVIVRQRDEKDGNTVLGLRTARRGEEINFRGGEEAQVTAVRPGSTAPERLAQYDFRTDTVVVDIAESESGEAKVLVLGPDGQLSVRKQSGDAEGVLKAQEDIDRAAPPAAAEPIPEEKKTPTRGGKPNAPSSGGDLLGPADPNAKPPRR